MRIIQRKCVVISNLWRNKVGKIFVISLWKQCKVDFRWLGLIIVRYFLRNAWLRLLDIVSLQQDEQLFLWTWFANWEIFFRGETAVSSYDRLFTDLNRACFCLPEGQAFFVTGDGEYPSAHRWMLAVTAQWTSSATMVAVTILFIPNTLNSVSGNSQACVWFTILPAPPPIPIIETNVFLLKIKW